MVRNTIPSEIHAKWQPYERRPTWSVVSSAELAQVLGVHIQTISNYKLRGILPPPVQYRSLHSNKNYYRISTIRSWLESRTENEIHLEWCEQWLSPHLSKIESLEHAEYYVNNAHAFFGVEKSRIPAEFAKQSHGAICEH